MSLYAVNGGTSAAKSAAAAAAPDKLVTGVFHCAHYRSAFGHLIFFSKYKDVYHNFFHFI
jgi:hypothetical protein